MPATLHPTPTHQSMPHPQPSYRPLTPRASTTRQLMASGSEINALSYGKARILTRWAGPDNEHELLELAQECSANRLTAAGAKLLSRNRPRRSRTRPTPQPRRSLTSYTDGDGMTIIRIALPPAIAEPVLAAVDELVDQIARTAPLADAPLAETDPTSSAPNTSADASPTHTTPSLPARLSELRRRWQPDPEDDWLIPTMAQQRADAFTVLFSGLDLQLTTEIVIHIRGDGNTFDDGTPITTSAICRQLANAYIRLMIHDTQRRPINASNRRRHPTTGQKRVVLETHNHQCVDCQTTQLLELDHNPPYHQTQHTIASQLQPRCAPCHRARHRPG